MSKKYYEMEVLIKGVIRIPVNDYDSKDEAIECIEMNDDVVDIAYDIQQNNDQPFYISVRSAKEVEY